MHPSPAILKRDTLTTGVRGLHMFLEGVELLQMQRGRSIFSCNARWWCCRGLLPRVDRLHCTIPTVGWPADDPDDALRSLFRTGVLGDRGLKGTSGGMRCTLTPKGAAKTHRRSPRGLALGPGFPCQTLSKQASKESQSER